MRWLDKTYNFLGRGRCRPEAYPLGFKAGADASPLFFQRSSFPFPDHGLDLIPDLGEFEGDSS